MTEPIVLKFVGAPVYEGRWGWPGRDLTQKDLDDRGLSKAELLAYRPQLYVEERPEVKEAEPTRKKKEAAKIAKDDDLGLTNFK